MSTKIQNTELIALPKIPVEHAEWLLHVSRNPSTPMHELLAPYKEYDAKLREVFAQQPSHPAIEKSNIVPLFTGKEQSVRIRARNLATESEDERQHYLMPLEKADRKADGAPAIVKSLREFQTNFQLFSESALVDMDWSNVVVAGSAVVTSLLPVPAEHNTSKRALREYYHQKLAPASDVDLFLYGLTEKQAIEKIEQIEQRIRDSILTETTTIRTKNAITIASQYPTRHVQIVLRIYRSVSEILTGFDVDCSCAAYDGRQVYASPRAVAAYMTQVNTIDLTRRSPSYENRLSKYSHRGFEVYWPLLDRSRIDPTIFERSFGRTLGLARLLVLEKLPSTTDRDAYVDKRREERGRPAINRWHTRKHKLNGNVKEDHDDEVPDWVDSDEVSDYHTFTVPYGPKFHARKIERLLYAKDLLLNAEWNRSKERETTLHRHPAFFGNATDVIGDCCGYCPKPTNTRDEDIAEVEKKIYVSGNLTFIKDDPGRQAIGSFHPLTDDDWTEMAYVGNTARLCQAIVDGDVEHVQDWLNQEGADPNERDYTGRTPLQLAVMSSTIEIVQILIDAGARIVARMVDGRTALHLAAMRGEVAMVKALLVRSEANEEKEVKKEESKLKHRNDIQNTDQSAPTTNLQILDAIHGDEDIDMLDDEEEDHGDTTTDGSIVNIRGKQPQEENDMLVDENEGGPDVYDINVLTWDVPVSPLHLAIANGHAEVVKLLVQEFGADVLLPVKLVHKHDKSPRAAILPLVLAVQLPPQKADEMTRVLIDLGASPAQADVDNITALHYFAVKGAALLATMISSNQPAAKRAVNHLHMSGHEHRPSVKSALQSAIEHGDTESIDALLELGAQPQIDFGTYISSYKTKWEARGMSEQNQKKFQTNFQQPILTAAKYELPNVVTKLLGAGADINCLSSGAWQAVYDGRIGGYENAQSLMDVIHEKIKCLQDWIDNEQQDRTVMTPGMWGGWTQVFPPVPLKEDAHYLEGLEPGTYAYWSTLKQLQTAKSVYKQDLDKYHDAAKAMHKKTDGWKEKLAAVKALIVEYESLEVELLKRGAKTFKELYPDIELNQDQGHHLFDYKPDPPKPWTPKLNFYLPDLTEEQRESYIKLFQACWDGNLSTVKELTLAIWGENQTPLKIAVQDDVGFSPFSIAVLRKHFDLAKALLEIAHIQFAPEDKPGQSKYSLHADDSDDEDRISDGNEKGEIQLLHDIIDDNFTIENIGEVQSQVKSRVSALDMLGWSCPVSRFLEETDFSTSTLDYSNYYSGSRHHYRKSYGGKAPRKILKDAANGRTYRVIQPPSQENYQEVAKPGNLFQLAIFLDDVSLFHFLINAGEVYTSRRGSTGDEPASKFYTFNEQDFLYAIQLGRVQLLRDIVRRTGAGIPLNDLVEKSGVEITEKPKYYQGLSVHGKKRSDWAAAGRDTHCESLRDEHPPLLHAARLTNPDSIEWFLSDAATDAYFEFAENNKKDVRIQSLEKAKGGLQAPIHKWLNLRSKLLIHVVVLSKTNNDSLELLRHLCKTHPGSVNHKSATGLTPLQLAFSLHRIEMAKILIEAGADQTSRNHNGDNLVHSALNPLLISNDNGRTKLRELLSLIDFRLMPGMMVERSTSVPGATTPLAQWIYRSIKEWHNSYGYSYGYHSYQYNYQPKSVVSIQEETLRIILEFSNGSDLSLVNGEGDTPLHAVVRYGADHLLRIMLFYRPELLFRENASGRTPYEMAEDAHLAGNVFENPPPVVTQHRNGFTSQASSSKILNREPNSFVEGKEDKRNPIEKIWDVCNEFIYKTSCTKRKLVSLLEANEVAKRLASKKTKTDVEEEGEEEQDKDIRGDEVDVWYGMGLNANKE